MKLAWLLRVDGCSPYHRKQRVPQTGFYLRIAIKHRKKKKKKKLNNLIRFKFVSLHSGEHCVVYPYKRIL